MRRLLELSLVAAAALLVSGCSADDSSSAEACGPATCAGCCDAQGRCRSGDALEACGAGGAACEACEAEGACRGGECVMAPSPDGDAGHADSGEESGDAASDAGSDGGSQDAGFDGSLDAGDRDAGDFDAGEPDAGEPDSGAWDAGENDAGATDAGEPDAGPAGEGCSNPFALTVGPTATSVTGSTAGMAGDSAGPCGGAGGADAVYAFTLAVSSDVRIQAVAGDASLRPVLYLRGAACSAPEVACSQAPAAGGEAFLQLHALAAGPYYLWIDGADGSAGSYALTIAATPPASGDSCLAPMPIDLSSGSAQAFGDTRSLSNDNLSATCGGASGRDLVFSLHVPTAGTVSAVVTPNTSTFQPVLYLRSAACEGSEVACQRALDAGVAATLEVQGLAAGDYFLWVDGVDARGGSFLLDVALGSAVP